MLTNSIHLHWIVMDMKSGQIKPELSAQETTGGKLRKCFQNFGQLQIMYKWDNPNMIPISNSKVKLEDKHPRMNL